MAQIKTVKLSRYDSTPWGFRLQGGKDFGTPLVIQKVNGGSLAEKAGLQVGDALLKVNNTDVSTLKHKDAQDVIVRSGNAFEFTIQRGGIVTTTWKPSVTPVNGHDGKQLVNKQYNSPVGIYSEESIAETLSAQAEVLAGGVLGVNFKKNEKNYTPSNSEVLKMVQEADQAPRSPEPVASATSYFATHSHATGGRAVSPRPLTPCALGLGHPPARPSTPANPSAQTIPQSAGQQSVRSATPANQQTSYPTESPVPFDAPKCGDCSQPISGVFVRIKEKNLHVECFKCATCGTSLKNVGYYNINNKLYCDVHAKMVARQNPPGPGLEPVTVPYGKKPPANTISQALTSHSVAPKSPVGQSYQAPPSLPPYSPSPTSLTGPKPFGAPNSIKPASDLDPDKNTPPSPPQVQSPISNGQTIGNNTNSAFAPVTKAQVETKSDETPTKVEEVLSPEKKALAMLSETISSTCLLRSIIEAEKRPSSPAVGHQAKREEDFTLPIPRPENQGIFDYATKMQPYYTRTTPVPHVDVHPPLHEIPHDVSSLLPPASLLRPLSPAVVLSFPPVFPALPAKPRSRCSSPAPPQHTPRVEHNIEPTPPYIPPPAVQAPPEPEEKPHEEPWVPAVYVPEQAPEHVTDLPKCYETRGPLAEAMTTAPITPFSPVPFPEPIEIPSMKPLPPESTPVLVRSESPMLRALTVAPDRSYSPLPSVTKPLESLTQLSDINKPVNLLFGEKEEPPKSEPCLTMLSALTIASDRPYSPIPAPPPPVPLPVVHHITDAPFETYVPKLPESKQADAKRSGKSDDNGSGKVHRSDEDPHHFPLTSSGLHIPATIPHYQEHIDEVPIHSMLRNSPLPMKAAIQESLTIQSKIMNILTQQDTSSKTTAISAEPLKPSALDFLKPKDDSTKIIPILGYKPNSLVDSKKVASQVVDKEGTQIVHEEKSETIESFSSESVTKTSIEKRSETSQIKQEKVCQQVCQSQCQSLPQCQKTKQPVKETVQKVDVKPSETKVRFENEPVKETVQKVDVKPSFEPKVRFERQNTFEPKASEPVFNGNPSSTAPSVSSELSRKLANLIPSMPSDPNPSSLPPNAGSGGGKGSSSGLTTAPRRGRGVLNPQNLTPGARVPQCGQCYKQIRGPFITALGKIWCPDHFTCVRAQCKRPLQDIGFVEEDNGLYCEFCFEQYLAPACYKCSQKIKGDCLNAIGRHYHPECFTCAYCGKLFGNNPFFLEEGLPYCENDWNDLFTTKCFACGFPIEAGDRWVEALSNNYHSLCFNCSVPSCKKNLEGQSFFAKAGRPFCKSHAR